MSLRNKLALVLILTSLGCLYPGLTEPMMNIYAGAKLPLVGELVFFDETQSIIQSIRALHINDNTFVAFLILLFSVLVPVLKALLLFIALWMRPSRPRSFLYGFVALIGKWSMADVFVVGVFIAFLATKSNPNIHAALYPGFYYFTAYCIISVIGIQVMEVSKSADSAVSKSTSYETTPDGIR